MEIVWLLLLGLTAGLFGGMLGLGGSTILIPGFVFIWGENQHLYQASAMICNFVVGISSVLAHRKAQSMTPALLKWLIPAAIGGVAVGVYASNLSFFCGQNSYLLARLFGYFLIYVLVYNCWRMFQPARPAMGNGQEHLPQQYRLRSGIIGFLTGLGAGLMGIGAGTISTPLQQTSLKMPLRQAMSNSAAIIVAMSWLGAVYKTTTLPQHGIAIAESLKIAALIIPTGILGGYIGGHLMHILPRLWVRTAFIAVLSISIWKLLTTHPQ